MKESAIENMIPSEMLVLILDNLIENIIPNLIMIGSLLFALELSEMLKKSF